MTPGKAAKLIGKTIADVRCLSFVDRGFMERSIEAIVFTDGTRLLFTALESEELGPYTTARLHGRRKRK